MIFAQTICKLQEFANLTKHLDFYMISQNEQRGETTQRKKGPVSSEWRREREGDFVVMGFGEWGEGREKGKIN